MNKIKILHVINTFSLGGAETNLLNILRHAKKSPFEMHVAYSYGGPFESAFQNLNLPLYKFSFRLTRVQSLETLFIVFRLASYIRKNNIDIVHTHNFNAHVWGVLAAKLGGAKTLEHVHDFRYESSEYLRANGIARPEQFKLAGFFSKMSDRIVVLTKNNRNFLLKNRFASPQNIRIVLNGMPVEHEIEVDRDKILKALNLQSDRRIIFWATRLSPEKNPGHILDVAEKLKNRLDVLFVVAGDGPLYDHFKAEVVKRNLQNSVRFIGFVPRTIEFLSICDIAIQPTFLELHSIMMMEAMSVRKPTLVSKDVGCNNDFITHGENGYLLNPREPDEWAETISQLLDNPDKAKSLGEAGRRLIEDKCSMKRVSSDLETIYKELIYPNVKSDKKASTEPV